MFEKFAEDVARKYQEKLAAIKEANSLRDAVRLGRISPETFKELRQSRKYLPFEQYQNMKGLDKATYFQSLMKDLRSKLRGKGKNGVPSQYDNFMQNEFNGDFTKEQYNKLFGYQTEYPSIGRMARGIIKGVNNRVEDINKRINSYNNNPKNVNREKLPTLELFSSNHRLAKTYSLDDTNPEFLSKLIQQYGSEDRVLKGLKNGMLAEGAHSGITQKGKKLKISVPSTFLAKGDDLTGMYFLRPFSELDYVMRIPYLESYIPSVYKQPGVDIGSRALVLQHEFDEALNTLNQISRLGRKHPSLVNKVMSKILHDSHGSSNVIGNEFLTDNAIFGSTFNSPNGLLRALKSFPVTSITNPGRNNLSGQAIGLDYSKPDGGFSKKFKNMKAFKKYLKRVQQNDIKVLQDNDYIDSIMRGQAGQPIKDPSYVDAATTKYSPNWNRNITEDDIRSYYENLRRNINKNDHIVPVPGDWGSEYINSDFENFLDRLRDRNISLQFPKIQNY